MKPKHYRDRRDLTALDLGRQCGLDQSQISRAESGRPTLYTSLRIAIGTHGLVMPSDLPLRRDYLEAVEQFIALVERLHLARLARDHCLRESS
jgi:transcriptional regulator with XRE-family HTH domain